MSYDLAGRFIEVCDCTLLCPCWVSEAPDDNHCTGLFVWDIGTLDGHPPTDHNRSIIDGTDVTGRRVVSVSIHRGRRPPAAAGAAEGAAAKGAAETEAGTGYDGTLTVLIVDHEATPEQYGVLVQAFRGALEGPLANLADVSGTVIQSLQAVVDLTGVGGDWTVKVTAPGAATPDLVDVASTPARFPPDDGQPLTLRHTALDTELGVRAGTEVTALQHHPPHAQPGLPSRRLPRGHGPLRHGRRVRLPPLMALHTAPATTPTVSAVPAAPARVPAAGPLDRRLVLVVLAGAGAAWGVEAARQLTAGHDHRLLDHPTPAVVANLAVGWMLMVVAMMVPPALPLLDLVRRLGTRRPDRRRLVLVAVAVLVGLWSAVGAGLVLG